MSQEPIPRGPLGQLIDDAKAASKKEWREIEAGSGIPHATIQAWTSGRVAEPPLRGLLHLARYLEIPPEAVMDRALEGYVPPLKARATDEVADPAGRLSAIQESGGVASDRDKKRGSRTRRPKRAGL